jgi:hypothetical protein
MRNLLLPFLLALAFPPAASAQLPPAFGPESPVSAADRLPGAPSTSNPVIASDGDGYFAAWFDSGGGIYGTRVSAKGEVLDPDGIRIDDGANAPNGAIILLVQGSRYVVGWIERGFGTALRNVSRDGRPEGPVVRLAGDEFSPPSIIAAAIPGAILLQKDASTIALLDADLRLIRTLPPLPGALRQSAVIAASGSDFLVSYLGVNNRQTIFTSVVVRPDGGMEAPREIPGEIASTSSIVWDGAEYLATHRFGANLAFSKLSRTGELLAATKVTDMRFPLGASVAPRPDGQIMSVTRDQSRIESIVVDAVGNTSVNQVAQATYLGSSAVASNARGEALVAWQEISSISSKSTIRASLLDAGARPAGRKATDPGFTLTQASSPQSSPALSKNTTNWIAWLQADADGSPLLYARDIASTRPAIRLRASRDYKTRPAIATDGNTVVVLWIEGVLPPLSLRKAEFDLDGGNVVESVLVPNTGATIFRTNVDRGPAVAWNGFYYLVAWGGENDRLMVAPMRPRGPLLVEGAPVTLPSRRQSAPVIVPAGETSLLIWQEDAFETPPRIAAARVSTGGFVLDSPVIISGGTRPDATWNGFTWVAAWTSATEAAVQAARIRNDGLPLDRFPVVLGTGSEATLGASGSEILAAWRGGGSVMISKIIAAGPLAWSTPAVLQPQAEQPVMLRLANGGAAVVYRRIAREPEFAGSPRLFVRLGAASSP